MTISAHGVFLQQLNQLAEMLKMRKSFLQPFSTVIISVKKRK